MCNKEFDNNPWKIKPECKLLNLIKDIQSKKSTTVTLYDDADGNAKGWNPNGSQTVLAIEEDAIDGCRVCE